MRGSATSDSLVLARDLVIGKLLAEWFSPDERLTLAVAFAATGEG
jgi:hypothetical protein